jgi:site-specific DNA-methyltransferase (adenine-specific)
MCREFELIHGDCLAEMPNLPEAFFDSVVCDPPYGLSFMGKDWDHGIPGPHFWREALRVAKPGSYLVAFGGTRTFHRLTCAIEDAGWEIRDCLMWLYGSGFPKSLDVSKAIDKSAGAERPVIGTWRPRGTARPKADGRGGYRGKTAGIGSHADAFNGELSITGPATDAAKQWEGWGTALKPAWEPIILARKPLIGTVAANVLEYGTGGINIDGCRIGLMTEKEIARSGASTGGYSGGLKPVDWKRSGRQPKGRWPANVMLDEAAARVLDAQTGILKSGDWCGQPTGGTRTSGNKIYGKKRSLPYFYKGDSGGASRFFYCAKASRREREYGCDDLPLNSPGETVGRVDESLGTKSPRAGAGRTSGSRNHHPTVKPVALMRWLCRLVTPPGGVVLDPFMGSGSTGIAANQEDFDFVGIELCAEYVEIARKRLAENARAPFDAPG